MNFRKTLKLNLSLFDGEAAGDLAVSGAGNPLDAAKGARAKAEPEVKYGIQEEEQVAAAKVSAETKPDFETLIKGEYKEDFNKRVQNIIDRRFKESKGLEEQLGKVQPLIDLLAGKYDVDGRDIDKLLNAIQSDDSFYEQAAFDRGLTVEQYKRILQNESENKRLRATLDAMDRERAAQAQVEEWERQSEALKLKYPDFDFDEEITNADFQRLIKAGTNLEAAYIAIHSNDILTGAMRYTAQEIAKKTADNIAARGLRPKESGISGQAASTIKSDVSKLTKEDRALIAARARRGEMIRF